MGWLGANCFICIIHTRSPRGRRYYFNILLRRKQKFKQQYFVQGQVLSSEIWAQPGQPRCTAGYTKGCATP